MIIKYQIASVHDFWGDYRGYIRFLNEKNEIIYSRDFLSSDFNFNSELDLLIHKESKCILLHEFDRNKFHQISLLDFKKKNVSRIYHTEKTPIKKIVEDFKYGNFKTFERTGKVSSFPIEKIKKPFFRFWSSPKLLFDE